MGCLQSKEQSDTGQQVPKWSNIVLASGGDKDIFQGTLGSKPCAVCVAKGGSCGGRRIRNEINIFKQVGKHPNIINMYYSGTTSEGAPYLAIEIVQPIGYDLDRLKNQYQFAGQSVPVALMGRIISQLAEALQHMHSKMLIHRDLKTENVLVNQSYHTKLIDMGIVVQFGASDTLRAPYMAPELCEGMSQHAEVDCWGVGLILHQVYQHRWQLLSCPRQEPAKMMPGIPSSKHAMDPHVQEAMKGLLKFNKRDRWTMDTLTNCAWLKNKGKENSKEWHKPTGSASEANRESLKLYQSSQPMPTALAVTITNRNHAHLIGKQLGDLQLGKELGVTVLLIKQANGEFVRVPGADTPINRGDWMYFGVPQGEGFSDAVDGLEKKLKGVEMKLSMTKSHNSDDSGRFRPLSKKEVVESGSLVEFAVEFDCFVFPPHIGPEAEVGPSGLDMRRRFSLNLVGIERELQNETGQSDGNSGNSEVEWFPSGTSKVKPGNLGLVMREPAADGSSRPTLTDKDLEPLMKKEIFQSNGS